MLSVLINNKLYLQVYLYYFTCVLYLGMSLANNSLLDGESFPSLCSELEQASINVCAITPNDASTVIVLLISNIKSGFLIKFTQNLKGKQFDFQEWMTSGSVMPWSCASESRRSKSHLTGGGRLSLVLSMVLKKSSTNCWIVPFVRKRRVRNISVMALCATNGWSLPLLLPKDVGLVSSGDRTKW